MTNIFQPFELMDCALITLATGKRALNLRELRDRILEVEESSLYYHFYETLLRPSFDDPKYRNDFALWARRALHQPELAEKLAILDPISCKNLGDLRHQLVDLIEDYLAEREYVHWAKHEQEFHFLTSRVVVFDTGHRFATLQELGEFTPRMGTGSVFYHFIEARRRHELNVDDFSVWLEQWGEETAELRKQLGTIDYYFGSLLEIRSRLAMVFENIVKGKERDEDHAIA